MATNGLKVKSKFKILKFEISILSHMEKNLYEMSINGYINKLFNLFELKKKVTWEYSIDLSPQAL